MKDPEKNARNAADSWSRGTDAIAAVIALGSVGLLLRSYAVSDSLSWRWSAAREWSVHSTNGELALYDRTAEDNGNPGLYLHSEAASLHRPRDEFDGTVLGFSVETATQHYRDGRPIVVRKLLLPLTGITVIAVAASAGIFLYTYRKRGMGGPWICATCGDDLRASRLRCPECGARFDWPKGSF